MMRASCNSSSVFAAVPLSLLISHPASGGLDRTTIAKVADLQHGRSALARQFERHLGGEEPGAELVSPARPRPTCFGCPNQNLPQLSGHVFALWNLMCVAG